MSLARGTVTVTDGPFTQSRELISYARHEVRSRHEAIEWACRFLTVHRGLRPGWPGRTDILQVMGARTVAGDGAARAAIEAVRRIESPRLITPHSRAELVPHLIC